MSFLTEGVSPGDCKGIMIRSMRSRQSMHQLARIEIRQKVRIPHSSSRCFKYLCGKVRLPAQAEEARLKPGDSHGTTSD